MRRNRSTSGTTRASGAPVNSIVHFLSDLLAHVGRTDLDSLEPHFLCKQSLARLVHSFGGGRKSSKKNKSIIRANLRQDYTQDPAETSVKIKVGGRATLYEGTFLRIRCPVKKFDRSLVSTEIRDGAAVGHEMKSRTLELRSAALGLLGQRRRHDTAEQRRSQEGALSRQQLRRHFRNRD